jgi:hypothetical protein
MPFLQEFIHKLEVTTGPRYLRISLAVLAVLALFVGYNWRSFRNLGTQEAMDAAQVARNLAAGNGYTTQFIRPFSLYLVKKRSEAKYGLVPPVGADYSRIKERHPDLANPPVYPCVLAALMKVLPFRWEIGPARPFWSNDGRFWRYEPDFLIALFNELLLFVVIALTFLLARHLFDPAVAWLSAILLLGCELLWRFSVSGLSTMLLLVIFLGLVWCLVLLEREVREPKWGPRGLLGLAAAAGLLLGLGALTRYAFGWLLAPVGVFLILFGGPRKAALCLLTLAVAGLVLAPWVYRNYQISGTPFGTATFALLEGHSVFPEYKLERSLEPNFNAPDMKLGTFVHKLLQNSRDILQNEVPRLGNSWLTPLFLASLLLGFRNPATRRLRYFVMLCLAVLIGVQALGRTQLTEDSPVLTTENLLVLLVPLIFVNAVSFFFVLLDQMKLLFRGMRVLVIGTFAFVMCLPMVFTFLPPRVAPVVYPPYYPPAIQQVAGWMKENELMMSDIPWAVAWYGNRQCIWTTLDAQEQFFAVNDLRKPVRALYLTPETMDSRFLTQWVRAGEHSWGSFILESMLRREIPPSFPLRKAPTGFLPEQLFLTDWDRWKAEPPVRTPTAEPPPAGKK